MSKELDPVLNAEIQAFVSSLASRGMHVIGGVIRKSDDGKRHRVTVFSSAPELEPDKYVEHVASMASLLYQTVVKVPSDSTTLIPIGPLGSN